MFRRNRATEKNGCLLKGGKEKLTVFALAFLNHRYIFNIIMTLFTPEECSLHFICTLSNKEPLGLWLDDNIWARVDGYITFFIFFIFKFDGQEEETKTVEKKAGNSKSYKNIEKNIGVILVR